MRPDEAHLLIPGTKVVIKNDFYANPVTFLRKYLGTTMTVRRVFQRGEEFMVHMAEENMAQFYIQEIDCIVRDHDCGDEEYQAVNVAELFA